MKSRSVNSSSLITIDSSVGTGLDDEAFLLRGHDGASTGRTTTESPIGYVRIGREWTTQETNSVDTTRLWLDGTGFNYTTGIYLLLDIADADLSDTVPVAMTQS